MLPPNGRFRRISFMKYYILTVFLWVFVAKLYGQTSGFADSEGVKIHYQIRGEGPPVLIMNGGPGFSSEGFAGLAEDIAELGYQSILFDQRGTGRSPLPVINDSTVTMDLMVRDIEAIREAMQIKSWAVLGHSFGGMLANYYTAKFPERVTALIHSSSGGVDLQLLQSSAQNLRERLTMSESDSLTYYRRQFEQTGNEADRRKMNYFLAHAYVYNKKHVPAVAERLMQGDLALNRIVWNDLIGIAYDCKIPLSKFEKPVLILQGTRDILPLSIASRANDVFPNSKLVFLDRCGHYGWLDRKKAYMDELERFLDRFAGE